MAVNSIVLVENDPETVKTIRETLEHAGYTVHVFDDPNTAYQQAREILPSLFFINLSVPGTNGLEICKTIHHDSSLTNVPIVLLTIREGKFDPIYTKLYGIVAFVKKPFEIHELLAVAQEFSPMKPAPPQETTPMSGAEEEPAVPLSELEEEAGEVLYGEAGLEEDEGEEEEEGVYQLSEEDLDTEQFGDAFEEDTLAETEEAPYGEMDESLFSPGTDEGEEEGPVTELETPLELEELLGEETEEVPLEESEEGFTDETAFSSEEVLDEESVPEPEEEEDFVPSLSYSDEEEPSGEESLEGVEDEVEGPHREEDILEMPEELPGETPVYGSEENLHVPPEEPGEETGPEDDFTLDEVVEQPSRATGIVDVRGRRRSPRKSRLVPLVVLFILVGLTSFATLYFFFTDVPYQGKDSLTRVRDTLSRVPYLGALVSGDEETRVTEAPAPPVPPLAKTAKEREKPEPAPPVAPAPSPEPATEKETVLAVPERVIGEDKPAEVSPPPPAPTPPRKVASKTKPVSAYYVQFGAFSNDPNANRFAKKLENRGLDVFIKKVRLKSGKELNYVLFGVGYGTREEAEKKADAIKKEKRVDTAVFH
jgi:CheY-like chemotaxis protein